MSDNDSNEIWKPIEAYPGRYISNFGRVRGLRGQILKGSPNDGGYPCVRLTFRGKLERVHILVFTAFNGPIPPGIEINHKDGITHNARLDNLEMATHQENIDHSIRILGHKRMPPIHRGEAAHFSKLTADKVDEIRELRGKMSYKEVAQRYGISYVAVYKVWNGETWKHHAVRPGSPVP